MTINSFIESNLAPVMGLVFLFVILIKNETIDKRSRSLFLTVCVLECTELVVYNLELITATWSEPTLFRLFLSAVGYAIRPMLAYSMIQMVKGRGEGRRKEMLLFLPGAVNILCAFSVFFTDIVYSYDENNVFIRGPLGYATQMCVIFYLIIFTITVIRKHLLEKNMEFKIMLLILVYMNLSMSLEAVFSIRSIGRSAIVLCTIFFMYALQTSFLKKHISVLAENKELKSALQEVEKAKQELIRSRSVTQALGEGYLSVFQVDIVSDVIYIEKIEEGYAFSELAKMIENKAGVDECIKMYALSYVVEDEREKFLNDFSIQKIKNELEEKKYITKRFNCTLDGEKIFCVEVHIVKISDGCVVGFKNVEELVEKEREQMKAMETAMKEAERANAAKSNFLSRMSHDIRTPLNGIIGLLKIDEEHFAEQSLVKENHKKMQISANYLLSLINDILQMSKLEDGNVVLSHEFIDLFELTKDIVTIIIGRTVDAGIEWDYEKGKTKIPYPYIYGSPVHLRQIFLNIYGNCIKYNRPGGKITTIVEVIDEHDGMCTYRWTIADTGIGMSEEFLKHIYDPFAQEKNDARSVYHGAGLGMAIVKRLIDKMGGNITISSKEGIGSTFIIDIPFEIAPPPGKDMEQASSGEGDISGMKLMLVEDNELNAEIAQILLSDHGAKVTTVHDGKQAVELFESNKEGTFDAILMDVMMPVMDGLTATEKIRALKRPDAENIPIIAMTANAFKEDAQKCFKAGMNAHLAKPLEIDRVKKVIFEQSRKVMEEKG